MFFNYDLFYKLLIQNDYNGSSTTKEIIGIVEVEAFQANMDIGRNLKKKCLLE